MIIPAQTRYVDAFSDIASLSVNNRLMAIIPNGNAYISGLTVTYSGNQITISPGTLVMNWVVITINSNVTIVLDSSVAGETIYVVAQYQYQLTNPPPQLEIGYVIESAYNSQLQLILAIVTVDSSGNVSSVSYVNGSYNPNPIGQQLSQELTTNGLSSNLNMNGYRITNIQNGTDPQDAVTMSYVNSLVGEVKIDSSDSLDYLGNKIVAGNGITVSTTGTSDLQLVIASPQNGELLVSSADSGTSFI